MNRVSDTTNKRVAIIGVLAIQVLLAPMPLFRPTGNLDAFAVHTAVRGDDLGRRTSAQSDLLGGLHIPHQPYQSGDGRKKSV